MYSRVQHVLNSIRNASIYVFIFFTAYPLKVVGELEAIPAELGERQVVPWAGGHSI